MGGFVAAIVGLVLNAGQFFHQVFGGKELKAGAAARSPRVTSAPEPPIVYVPRPVQEKEVAYLLLAGECVCVTGDPGIGKSSLARAARALLPRESNTR